VPVIGSRALGISVIHLTTRILVTRIVQQLVTEMRVTPLMEKIIVSHWNARHFHCGTTHHWNASHSSNGKKLLLATGMRDTLIVEQLITGVRVTPLMEKNYC